MRADAGTSGPEPGWLRITSLLVIAGLVYLVGHNHQNSLYVFSRWDGGLTEGLLAISEGSLRRRLGIIGFGVLGILLLARRWRDSVRLDPVVTGAALAFLLWSTASLAWADDAMLTFRRVGAFWLLAIGAAGVARAMRRETLVWFILLSGAAFIAIGLGVELLLGTFRPLASDHRFAGTLHPNAQGINCAFVVLAGLWLATQTPRRHRLLAVSLVAVGILFLVLTRSRTPFAALLGASLVLLVHRFRPGRRLAIAAVLVNVGLAGTFAFANGVMEVPVRWLLLGRGAEDLATLNSRVPLWQFLGDYVIRRPLAGYGYSGFMTPEHAAEIPVMLEFGVAGAHSVYLEILLGVGTVGLVAFLAFAIGALIQAGRAVDRGTDRAGSFLAGILVFELLMGILDATLIFPSWRIVTLILFASLCIAERRPRTASSRPAPALEWNQPDLGTASPRP